MLGVQARRPTVKRGSEVAYRRVMTLVSSDDDLDWEFAFDSRHLAFTAKLLGRPWRIFLISREGKDLREASNGEDNQGAPTWSPDGKVGCQDERTCAVRRVNLSTKTVSRLPGSDNLRTVRLAPNGNYIAALQPELLQLLLLRNGERGYKVEKLADAVTGDDISWSRDSCGHGRGQRRGLEGQVFGRSRQQSVAHGRRTFRVNPTMQRRSRGVIARGRRRHTPPFGRRRDVSWRHFAGRHRISGATRDPIMSTRDCR